jgi:isopenicillin-N epimerase
MASETPSDLLRHLFLLDETIHFLNHGSFGACPRPVFEAYQNWQRRLEREPVLLLGRELYELDRLARASLGEHFHAPADDLVFLPNATTAVNIVSHSLGLKPGDEVLASDHEYGACEYAWEYACKKTGATTIRQPIPLPVSSPEQMADQFWQGVSPHTRVIFLSHISSPTALRLPVELICARARERGILTLVDGAHAPGQIPLDLLAVGADFYTGNLHKWMLCPKGAAFLYARPEVQSLLEPLVVSWGYHPTPLNTRGNPFQDLFGWTGTDDPSAYLSFPAAVEFMREHHWDEVRRECHTLLRQTLERINALTGLPPPYPLDSDLYAQMGIAPLPPSVGAVKLQTRLFDEYRVEVPIIEWNGHKFVRISVQGYNTQGDLDVLIDGIKTLTV